MFTTGASSTLPGVIAAISGSAVCNFGKKSNPSFVLIHDEALYNRDNWTQRLLGICALFRPDNDI